MYLVLFVCKCILYCCHRVSTKLQLTYRIIYYIISYILILFTLDYHVEGITMRRDSMFLETTTEWR